MECCWIDADDMLAASATRLVVLEDRLVAATALVDVADCIANNEAFLVAEEVACSERDSCFC